MAKPAGVKPEMDAYQQWLADQEAAKLEKLAEQANSLQLSEPFSGKAAEASPDFQLKLDPTTIDPTTTIENQNVQLQAPAMIEGMGPQSAPIQGIGGGAGAGAAAGASAGTMAGAGIAAAGQAVSIIAQLAGAKAAKDAMLASNEANRSASEKLARMSLQQNSSQFNAAEKMNAYGQLMAALNQAGNQTMQQRALNRANQQTRGDGLTTAFLGA